MARSYPPLSVVAHRRAQREKLSKEDREVVEREAKRENEREELERKRMRDKMRLDADTLQRVLGDDQNLSERSAVHKNTPQTIKNA